ncbi:unnamed protein product [Toxocara canis]|uniref:Uncharacterized protein n=1 Tax=Toxocara canis TaxID=6265 RepID=A0A183V8Y1_TOXCA|nr:unnamed protein product [Toxocara canis]
MMEGAIADGGKGVGGWVVGIKRAGRARGQPAFASLRLRAFSCGVCRCALSPLVSSCGAYRIDRRSLSSI